MDKNGQCALVHAALRGHLEVVKFLIQCDWTMASQQQGVFKKSQAIQQALIAAASMGYTEVRKQAIRFVCLFVFNLYVERLRDQEKRVALLQNCHLIKVNCFSITTLRNRKHRLHKAFEF